MTEKARKIAENPDRKGDSLVALFGFKAPSGAGRGPHALEVTIGSEKGAAVGRTLEVERHVALVRAEKSRELVALWLFKTPTREKPKPSDEFRNTNRADFIFNLIQKRA